MHLLNRIPDRRLLFPTKPSCLPPSGTRCLATRDPSLPRPGLLSILFLLTSLAGPMAPSPRCGSRLVSIAFAAARHARYGSDMEGGGPYAYPDPNSPRDVTGFEVELMAMLASDLGATPEFCQGQWDMLLQLLDLGRSDCRRQRLRVDRPRAHATTWRLGRITSISFN